MRDCQKYHCVLLVYKLGMLHLFFFLKVLLFMCRETRKINLVIYFLDHLRLFLSRPDSNFCTVKEGKENNIKKFN